MIAPNPIHNVLNGAMHSRCPERAPTRSARRGKQKFSWLPVGNTNVIIDRLPGLFGEFEPHGLPRLLLTHRRSVDGIAVRGDVLDLERHDIAATEFAVDGEIEHCQVTLAVSDLELGANRPDMLWPRRGLGSHQLALVPGDLLGRDQYFAVLHDRSPHLMRLDQHDLKSEIADQRPVRAELPRRYWSDLPAMATAIWK
jgi:hypothetical protein